MEKTLLVTEYKQGNPSLSIHSLCHSFGLARSSFYAGVKSIKRNNKLDKIVWNQILKLWEKLPGIGYRKLATKLNCNGKKVLRILRKYRTGKNHLILPKSGLLRNRVR